MRTVPQRRSVARTTAAWLLAFTTALCAIRSSVAATYISAEPIPSAVIVGAANLARIESLGYRLRARWSLRLAEDCRLVDHVIDALADGRAVTTLGPRNTRYRVAAGGFEGVTDPSYVFTLRDSGADSASAADAFVLDNALGYVLNQSGTAQFTLPYDPANAYEFPLAYAVATFDGALTGEHAARFFDHLGAIDPKLWTGPSAGFTQIGLGDAWRDDSLLFLIGDVSSAEFTRGLYQAVRTSVGWRYAPLGAGGLPATATAGVAFPGNGWATPSGGYLENIPASAQLRARLAALRQIHRRAADDLLRAISLRQVGAYLTSRFTCPRSDR